jgi:hypothetical protein
MGVDLSMRTQLVFRDNLFFYCYNLYQMFFEYTKAHEKKSTCGQKIAEKVVLVSQVS